MATQCSTVITRKGATNNNNNNNSKIYHESFARHKIIVYQKKRVKSTSLWMLHRRTCFHSLLVLFLNRNSVAKCRPVCSPNDSSISTGSPTPKIAVFGARRNSVEKRCEIHNASQVVEAHRRDLQMTQWRKGCLSVAKKVCVCVCVCVCIFVGDFSVVEILVVRTLSQMKKHNETKQSQGDVLSPHGRE